MENNEINLSYYQIMTFMHVLSEFKNNNPYFNDAISNNFERDILNQSSEIVSKYPEIILDFKQQFKPFKISQSMYNYLVSLTGVNPLDKKIIKKYIPIIRKIEDEALTRFVDREKRKL